MIAIDVRDSLNRLERQLTALGREQLPFATSVALNRTAFAVVKAEQKQMQADFASPTPFTLRSLQYVKATKTNLTAIVQPRSASADRVLSEQVAGTPARAPKNYERAMRSAGVLPEGKVVVPGSGAKIDRYGNLDRTELTAILAMLGVLSAQAKLTRTQRRAVANEAATYFLSTKTGRTAHLAAGIWRKTGRRISPILLFVSRATYRARYRWLEAAETEVARTFPMEFDAALQKAMESAR